MIPFSPPRIDDKICEEVISALKSGWITTGPRTKLFEKKITEYCGNKNTICLNSATAGLEIILRWFGVTEGDEVILPAYTYSATANVIIHVGAKPVFVDVNQHDFNISVTEIEKAITKKTKVIMPVDFGGLPCDYDEINKLVLKYKSDFEASKNSNQQQLGRILILSDSAHSFGAFYKNKKAGSLTDVSVFSFHAVKNLTTAEGGAVALNLPAPFDNELIYKQLCISTLHGQNKDALAKTQKGNWRYDILEAGYKCNMTDLCAAIGLIELERYDKDTLIKRKHIVDLYNKLLIEDTRLELPFFETEYKTSSFHLYPLRLKNVTEQQRDAVMQHIFDADVSVNVHFLPVPGTTYYKSLGYNVSDYKVAYDNYSREISLPIFYDLSDEQIKIVVNAVIQALDKVVS